MQTTGGLIVEQYRCCLWCSVYRNRDVEEMSCFGDVTGEICFAYQTKTEKRKQANNQQALQQKTEKYKFNMLCINLFVLIVQAS